MTLQSSSDTTVVSLSAFRERAQEGPMQQVEDYWEGLRKGRIMPSRADVDPRGIAGALENAFILERVARGVGRFRIAGRHLNDVMGMEVRGMPLTALILPESRESVADALSTVFDEPATIRLSLVSESGLGKPRLEAKMLLMPLRSDLGDVSRILGCFVTEGKVGRAPRRFVVSAQSRRTLIGFGGDVEAPREVAPAAEELSMEPAVESPRPPSRRPYLVLVHNND